MHEQLKFRHESSIMCKPDSSCAATFSKQAYCFVSIAADARSRLYTKDSEAVTFIACCLLKFKHETEK